MKKIILLSISLCLCSLAYAENEFFSQEPYAKLQSGVSFAQSESYRDVKPGFRPGYFASTSFGYQWRYGLQTEVEFAYRRNSMRFIHYFGRDFRIPGHYQSFSYLFNLMWECSLGEYFLNGFQPYLGTGFGYDVQQFHASQGGFRLDKNKRGFAWQLMCGFSYPVSERAEFALEYKYHKGPLRIFFATP